jgi:fructose-bisphosphate aldolase class II
MHVERGGYRTFGLVNTRRMFESALREKYAIPGYNFFNLEQLRAIMQGCIDTNSPVILQVLQRNLGSGNLSCLPNMVKGMIASIGRAGRSTSVALHLDHGTGFETCRKCVDAGFSSVMIDGSQLPYGENIKLTRKVADYAREHDVSVEGELGGIAGITERVTPRQMYTKPAEVEQFIKDTGIDSLAISIGTAHGPFKSKSEDTPPELRLDILDEIKERVGDFPLVLHGASNVPKQYVEILRRYGGQMEGAVGIGDDQLQAAIERGIRKANFDTDIKLIFAATARQFLAENPKEFDPKGYLDIVEARLREYVMNRNEVLSSTNKAPHCT